MRRLLPFLLVVAGLPLAAPAQKPSASGAPPASVASPPPSPALARSSWPIFHANTHATAASPRVGPGDARVAAAVPALTARRVRGPAVSPWTVLAAPYPDGSQAVLTTPNDGIAKYLLTSSGLEPVAFLPLERRTLDFDWGIALLADGTGVATERLHNRLVLFGDARPEPRSPLLVRDRIEVDRARHGGLTAHFTIAPDGRLIALTDTGRLLAIDLRRRAVIAILDLPRGAGTAIHNSFPIDETGRIFLGVTNGMVAVDWTGTAFSMAWTAEYDTRGPGCERVPDRRSRLREAVAVARGDTCTGSGTTPTVLGGPRDGIVVIVDGHQPRNNLVAFWRGDPPPGWARLRDPTGRAAALDPRVAGVFPLPHSTPLGAGFSAENSPAALGHAVVVAQWAGFSPGPDAPRGVQRVDWDPAARRFRLAWANPQVHLNGVPTIACRAGQACRVYGMGRYPQGYRYTSLDFGTGVVTGSVSLGESDDVLDQGNSHAVAEDGSIIYSGRRTMVLVR